MIRGLICTHRTFCRIRRLYRTAIHWLTAPFRAIAAVLFIL